MLINASYDSSVSSAPSWFKSAVTYAVNQMDALIATNITVNMTFSWGEENGNVIGAGHAAQNQSYGGWADYSTLYNQLKSRATSAADQTAVAALPTTNPTGSGKFWIPNAMQKALGLMDGNASGTDGFVGLDSSLNWSTNFGGAPAAGQYDVVSTLEHEISEELGRVGYLADSQHPNEYGPMDLFRYSAPGQRALTPGAGYFSIDGKTMEATFNNPTKGGDAADWTPTAIGDTFSDTAPGVQLRMSATDLQILDVLGYAIGTAPADTTATSAAAVTAPTVTFSTAVSFQGPQRATFGGTVSDPNARVEVYEGSQDLGAAKVNANGTWSLTAALAANTEASLSAVASNAAGSNRVAPSFSLTTGIKGARYVTAEQIYDGSGNVLSNVFVRRNGAVHTMQVHHRAVASSATNQSVSGDAAVSTPAGVVHVGHGASVHGSQGGSTFVFGAHPGQATVADFLASGSAHDALSFSSSTFSSVADILHHTHQVGNDAIITLGSHDAVTLQNTSVAALRHHARDFSLHA